jgi:ribosomal protein S18 acetylase RimI-like enzyme
LNIKVQIHDFFENPNEQVVDLAEIIIRDGGPELGSLTTKSVLPREGFSKLIWAEYQKQPVGFVTYFSTPDAIEVILLATDHHYRRKGVMKSMVEHLVAQLLPGQGIIVEVHPRNFGALALYKNMGFGQIGERPQYYPDGSHAIVLKRDR